MAECGWNQNDWLGSNASGDRRSPFVSWTAYQQTQWRAAPNWLSVPETGPRTATSPNPLLLPDGCRAGRPTRCHARRKPGLAELCDNCACPYVVERGTCFALDLTHAFRVSCFVLANHALMIIRQRALLIGHSVDRKALRLLLADGFEIGVRGWRLEGSFDDDDWHGSLLEGEVRSSTDGWPPFE